MISVADLTYFYPERQNPALEAVSWQVDDGEFILVSGPSGSGKSTLLRCLNGLVPHFSGGTLYGKVTVDGRDTVSAGPRVLSGLVGFVAQDPESQAVLDQVEAEIAFALENAAVPPADMHLRVEETLDLLELTPLRHRALRSLSGGERQRLALAAALALHPKVLVLDEPTSQLDPQSADEVLEALLRLRQELGLTIILAEHRLDRVAGRVDRVTWLEGGRIVMDAPARATFSSIEFGPPVTRLARALRWDPLPLTVEEGRQFASRFDSRPKLVTASQRAGRRTMLEVRSASYSYGRDPALHSVNLAVKEGEAIAIAGRNGAGKSTLLKCIVGLLQPSSGEIRVDGRSTRGRQVADICREVGYLPQNPDDLLFAETVLGEFQITLDNHGLVETPGMLNEHLRQLDLDEVGDRYPRDLSVGQRQRVALGAVTVTRPRLLLLDEPTRGLDSELKESLIELWQRWLAQGTAIVLVTHDVELAARVASKTVLLDLGSVIAAGSSRDVLGSSPVFMPQIAKLFPNSGWLTVSDALTQLGESATDGQPETIGTARRVARKGAAYAQTN